MADTFDPDAYLAKPSGIPSKAEAPPPAFDPDTYLASKPATEAMAAPSAGPAATPAPFNPDTYLSEAPKPVGEEPAGVLSTFGSQAAKAAIGLPGEVLKGVGVGLGSLDDSSPIESGALYRTGVAMSKYADKWGATDESIKANPIASAAGSTLGGFTGAVPALLASVAGAPALATTGLAAGTIAAFAAAGAGSTFNEALLKGADESTAAKAAGLNAIVAGGLGALPLGAMLSPIRAYAPELTGWAANTLEKALVSGVVFTTIGEAQEFLGRQIAKNFYDPDTGYSPDIYRVLGSLIGGGIIGTVTPKMLHREQNDPVTDQAVQAAAVGVTRPLVPPNAAAQQKAKHLADVATQMPAPVVVADETAKAVGEEPPKIPRVVTEATGVASAPKAEDGWLAYHGSAADFEAFDPHFIGTGEGRAPPGTGFDGGSFGWGHYVGENRATGTDYQNRMASYKYNGEPYDATNPEHMAAFLMYKENGDRNRAIQRADGEAAKGTIGPSYEKSAKLYDAASKVLTSEVPLGVFDRTGNLYSTLIKRPKDQFLEWEKPLSEQSPYVQKAVERAFKKQGLELSERDHQLPGRELYAVLKGGFETAERTGVTTSPDVGAAGASKRLHDEGIAGNRYLDAGSRTRGADAAFMQKKVAETAKHIADLRADVERNKTNMLPAFYARREADIRQLEADMREQQRIVDLNKPENLTYNAVVFDGKDIDVTHKNDIPITAAQQKAIDHVRNGGEVEDENGRAIVNGREVENISADDMKGFAPIGPSVEAPPVTRDNGYDVNRRAMNEMGVKDFPDTPITQTTTSARTVTENLFPDKVPPEAKAMATAADHFSRKVRWLVGLRELLAANPHIKALQDYGINLDHMLRYAAERIIGAEDTVHLAMALSSDAKAATYKLIKDYGTMAYLTPEERAKQIIRRPTDAEFAKMVKDSGVNKQGLNVFSRMVTDFNKFTADMLSVQREKTANLSPKEMGKANERIDAIEAALNNRPYFPFTRFGLYTVLVQGPDGPKYFRAETKREQTKIRAELERTKKPGETVTIGKLPESSIPFSGLPVQLLDVIQKQFMEGAQHPEDLRQAFEQLKYESSPIRGITNKFANKYLTPGYSEDFFRSYANFFFHGSRYLSRFRYLDLLKQNIIDLSQSAEKAPDPNKRREISDYVNTHYKGLLDPTTDWSIPRAFLFHMILGFRVASAATNLTQTLISTYPHLAAAFGDLGTMRSITKATADWKNFYSRLKTMEQTGPEFRAMQELMRLGVIRGAFAPEIAGLSENRNLLGGYGGELGKKANQALQTYMQWSAKFFELSEQVNRRVAGMATYDLAMRNPDAKFVKDSAALDYGLRGELVAKGFTIPQANAIVAAKIMIDRTQGQYTREYRPAYMKGPLGSTIFTFKLFTHQMVGNMWNYPAAGWRMVLVMGFLGGLAGLPGFQDLNGVLKAAGYWMFGKDFDLEDEARRFAVEVLGMKGKGILDDPFTITRGFASRGYGIPALLDSIGEWSGVGKLPIPELDRTAAVSLGNLLPIDFGQLGPQAQRDPATAFANAVARGSGAAGSYAWNTFKAIMNMRDAPDDLKRWEKVEPTFLANMSQAARTYQEGAVLNKTGAAVVRFDPHDSQHMAEIIAMSLGYTPSRLNREWTRIRAEAEAEAVVDVRRAMLLNQMWSAVRTQNDEDKIRVLGAIRKFNEDIRDTDARAKVLSPETIVKSMQTRALAKAKQEAGIPKTEADIPIVRGVRELFPGAVVDTRPER